MEIGRTLIITSLELYRLKISCLLLGRLYHFCGVVFLWPLMWFSKLTILRFPCLQTSLLETWPHHSQNIALMRKAKGMKIVMSWLEMQLLESFSTFFYIVPEKKSAVLELSGCYHLQCMLANTQPFSKCFLKFRFAIPLWVKISTMFFFLFSFLSLRVTCWHWTFAKYYGLLAEACVLKFNVIHIQSLQCYSLWDVVSFWWWCFYRAEIAKNQWRFQNSLLVFVVLLK